MTEIPHGRMGVKGTWDASVVRRHSGDPIKIATLCCPNCGRDISLTGKDIGKDGIVAGDLVCQREGCGWKDEVRLSGWGDPLF